MKHSVIYSPGVYVAALCMLVIGLLFWGNGSEPVGKGVIVLSIALVIGYTALLLTALVRDE